MRLTLAALATLIAGPVHSAGSVEEALSEIASSIIGSLPQTDAPSLAVSTFTHSGNTCSELSNYASEVMVPIVGDVGNIGLTVYTRNQLSAIFREESLVYDGTISPGAAQRVGEISGVESILTASLIPRAERMNIVAQLIATEDGRILGSARSFFPITPTDAADIAGRSPGLCGFALAAGAPMTAQDAGVTTTVTTTVETPARPDGGTTFAADVFEAEVVNLFYDASEGRATWALRFRNTAEVPIGLSWIPESQSVTDGSGGVMNMGETWAGLRKCINSLRYCTPNYPEYTTKLAPSGVAQLNFDTTGTADLSTPNLSLTFEVVLTPDAAEASAYEVRSVGFFDLQPTLR